MFSVSLIRRSFFIQQHKVWLHCRVVWLFVLVERPVPLCAKPRLTAAKIMNPTAVQFNQQMISDSDDTGLLAVRQNYFNLQKWETLTVAFNRVKMYKSASQSGQYSLFWRFRLEFYWPPPFCQYQSKKITFLSKRRKGSGRTSQPRVMDCGSDQSVKQTLFPSVV